MDEKYAKTGCDGVNGGGRNTGRRWPKCNLGNEGDGGTSEYGDDGSSNIGSAFVRGAAVGKGSKRRNVAQYCGDNNAWEMASRV